MWSIYWSTPSSNIFQLGKNAGKNMVPQVLLTSYQVVIQDDPSDIRWPFRWAHLSVADWHPLRSTTSPSPQRSALRPRSRPRSYLAPWGQMWFKTSFKMVSGTSNLQVPIRKYKNCICLCVWLKIYLTMKVEGFRMILAYFSPCPMRLRTQAMAGIDRPDRTLGLPCLATSLHGKALHGLLWFSWRIRGHYWPLLFQTEKTSCS